MGAKKFAYLALVLAYIVLHEIRASQINATTEISYLHVISHIQSRFAISLVTSQIRNLDDKAAREIFFRAQLPQEAFITNFSMQINDKIVFGDVKEKEKAKRAYQTAVDRGQSAGLVAEVPRATNNFQISVNVGPKEKVTFNLTYQEVLKRTHGVYKHVINLQRLQAVNDLRVEVFINEQGKIKDVKVPKFGPKMGEKSNAELLNQTEQEDVDLKLVAKDTISHAHLTYVPKQPVSNNGTTISGQLVVLYDVERDDTGGVVQVMDGYFVHFFSPAGLKKGPKNIVFVLDKSGSMIGRKFEQTKIALKRILSELDEQDRFDIVMFADNVQMWKREFVPANADNKQKAKLFVDDTEAGGGTDIFEALQQAIAQLKQVKSVALSSMIVFLTDGEPTVGVTDNDVIVRNTTWSNADLKYALHSLAFGQYADYRLVQRLSEKNYGLARKIYEDADADLQLTGFYGEISSPLLTNVRVEYLNDTVDVSTLVRSGEYNLYEGGEFMVVGKLKEPDVPVIINPLFDVQIDARSLAGPVSYFARSQPIACRGGYQIVEGDILVPCCPLPVCPPPRPPLAPEKSPLPATSLGGFIERMWAYQTVKKLLKSAELEKDGQDATNEKALQLSLKYKFVTSLTSMVVVQPEEAANDTNTTTRAPIELKPVPIRDSGASAFDQMVYGQPGLMAPAARHLSLSGHAGYGYHAQSLMGPPQQQYAEMDHDVHYDASSPPYETLVLTSDKPKSLRAYPAPVIVFLDVTPNCTKCLENLAYLRDLKLCLRSKSAAAGQARDKSIFVNLNLVRLSDDGSSMNRVNNYTGPIEEVSEKIEEFRGQQWEEFVNSSHFMKTLDQLTTDGDHVILYMTGDGRPDKAKKFQDSEKQNKTKVYLVHLADTSGGDANAWKLLASNESMFFEGRNSYSALCNVL